MRMGQLRSRQRLRLVGLPLAIAGFGLLETVLASVQPVPAAAVMSLLGPLPLIARYRWPAAAALGSVSFILWSAVLGVDLSVPVAPVVTLGLAAFGLGARLPLRAAVLTGLGLVALVASSEFVEEGIEGSNPIFAAVLTYGALAMGRVLQTRFDALQAAAAASREVAVAQERQRIARELHDLIAHSLSVMVVQASAAEQVLRRDPDKAERAVREVQTAGRAALSETARLLDLLRDGPAEALPQPVLADLRQIVTSVPGLEVELHLAEGLPALPPGAEVSVCRIAQEALTNVLKHSESRRARVALEAAGEVVELRVEDPGPATRWGAPLPGGHGVLGMRERIGMFGGSLHAGPTAGGGWLVRAAFPVEASA